MKKYTTILLIILTISIGFNSTPTYAANYKHKAKATIHKITKTTSGVTWTKAALKELRKTPSFVRAIIKQKINAYAAKHHIKVITPQVYKSIHV